METARARQVDKRKGGQNKATDQTTKRNENVVEPGFAVADISREGDGKQDIMKN